MESAPFSSDRSASLCYRIARARLCILVPAVAIMALAGGGAAASFPLLADGEGAASFFSSSADPVAIGGLFSRAEDGRGFDVVHYDLDLEIADTTLLGDVSITLVVMDEGFEEVIVDLYDAYEVTGVSSPAHAVSGYVHDDDRLAVAFVDPPAVGDTVKVEIAYSGTPPTLSGSPQPFTFATHRHEGRETPVIYSLSIPDRAGAWWPCKDAVFDRATASVAITVADSLVAVSNGVLDRVVDLEGGRHRYHWSHAHPIAPYLVSVAVSDYVAIDDEVLIDVDGVPTALPLQYFVYPEDEENALTDLACLKDAIVFFSGLFGPYAFLDEKYGIAEIQWSGCMEHQTCTSVGSRYLNGTGQHESIHVHELAHQWWGDDVGLADWRDVWLNEGFATYCEALWFEHEDGVEAYHDHMRNKDAFPPPENPDFHGTIYDPQPLFGSTPYNKGAWVLHMLRHVIGDEAFFASLRAYGERFGGGENVTTEDFRSVCEEASALDLSQFFLQWIYHPGRPAYEWRWGCEPKGAGYEVTLDIAQTQADYEAYVMPIDVRIATNAGEQLFVIQNSQRQQAYSFLVADRPLGLDVDPGNWILKAVPSPQPTAFLFRGAWPNPAKEAATLSFFTPNLQQTTLDIFDVSGRRVIRLYDGVSGGARQVVWNGRDADGHPVSSGVYFALLRVPGLEETSRVAIIR